MLAKYVSKRFAYLTKEDSDDFRDYIAAITGDTGSGEYAVRERPRFVVSANGSDLVVTNPFSGCLGPQPNGQAIKRSQNASCLSV
jgi:hypothetical protein